MFLSLCCYIGSVGPEENFKFSLSLQRSDLCPYLTVLFIVSNIQINIHLVWEFVKKMMAAVWGWGAVLVSKMLSCMWLPIFPSVSIKSLT